MSGFMRLASSVVLAALAASPALAGGEDDVDPFDALKEIARAKFEAAHRTPAERAREMAETARAGLQARFLQFQAGKITPELLLAWSPLVLKAELGVLDRDADSGPLYEWSWRNAREVEIIAEVKLQAGKIAVSDMAEARCMRLQAQIDWLAHRRRGDQRSHALGGADPFSEIRNTAREEWEALQADPRQLGQERLDTAREAMRDRLSEFQAGKITPTLVLEAKQHVLDAEFALLAQGADPTPILEGRWKTLQQIEEFVEAKYEAGKISDLYDLETCRCCRLEAEIAWIQAWNQGGKPGSRSPDPEGDEADERWAKTKAEASGADVSALLRERLQAARHAYRDADRDFSAGKITEEGPLGASILLLAAERAVAAGPKDEAAAQERCWRRAVGLEAIARDKLGKGKIAVADVMATRFARLEAEAAMEEAAGRDGP